MDVSDHSDPIALRWLVGDVVPGVNLHENSEDVYDLTLPMIRGDMRLELDGRVFHDGEVRPGMLRILHPGERVAIYRRSRAKAALLSMTGPWAPDPEGSRRRWGDAACGQDAEREPARRAAGPLVMSATDIDPRQQCLYLQGIASMLLAVLLSRETGTSRRQPGGLSDAEFNTCVQIADTCLGDRLDLESWAATLGMPLAEFARRFRVRTRSSPYSWLLDRRILRARLLPTDPNLTLAGIALDVGFSSQSHFTDAFRRRVGMAPGLWRRRTRQAH